MYGTSRKNKEKMRLEEAREGKIPWKKWGPYLRERQWGTVREDYSENGDVWNFFTHGQARSRAYRWGEAMDLREVVHLSDQSVILSL